MPLDTAGQDSLETLELPSRMHPVLAALAVVPIAIILLTLAALALAPPPLPLMVILALVMICCALLAWQALSIMLGGKLEMTSEGLTVKRLLRHEYYPWTAVEKCKVMPATGTFGDNPLSDAEQRVGVGLFLRGLDRQRDHDLDADVVLCAGDKTNVQPMMRVANRIEKAAEKVVVSRRRPARAATAPSAAGRPLRRRQPKPEAAAKPADLVARFRNAGD